MTDSQRALLYAVCQALGSNGSNAIGENAADLVVAIHQCPYEERENIVSGIYAAYLHRIDLEPAVRLAIATRQASRGQGG